MATRDIPKDRTDQTEELSTILRQTHPGNSHKARDLAEKSSIDIVEKDGQDEPREKKVRQVTKAKSKKQGLLRKFTRYIFEDTIETAKEKAFSDVIKPGLQQLIFDTGNELLSLVIFGTAEEAFRSSRRGSGGRRGERTSYDKYYKDKERKQTSRDSYRDVPYDPDDIILDTNAEARDVLTELDYTIQKYGQASVADLYDIVGVTSEWTDNRYGWTSIRGAKIKPIREGFLLVLPRTHVLD